MPFPGSQEIDSLEFAYFLHKFRWVFRVCFASICLVYFFKLWAIKHRISPIILVTISIIVFYLFNFKFSADAMFQNVKKLDFHTKETNKLSNERLVIGIEYKGEAKAYPIEYLAYHHQVIDTIMSDEVMITYCSVCRSGRAYLPQVKGKKEQFRLVGMDHFNAMFEDKSTGSWWRQVNGEAVAGILKGQKLTEIFTLQMTVQKWFETYPKGKIMAPDNFYIGIYDSIGQFEKGKNKSKLTGRDTNSWAPKSWVVGVEVNGRYKAYDWNELVHKRIINDIVHNTPIVVALSKDGNSFAAFERKNNSPTSNKTISLKIECDFLIEGENIYNFKGLEIQDSIYKLKPILSYQEFWHSWKTFHPNTEVYR